MAEIHGFVVGKATSHVPAHLECFVSDAFCLSVHVGDDFVDLVRVRDQEAESKKRAMSKVKDCSYLCWQFGQDIFNGLSSLSSRSLTA